ncbi:hypothetical protein [Ramlibacter albus]|uniref:Uncharacterized protein n=1 Tax=Ramlibacter albus TaxID=2079448 RepID=A0A923S2X9_9BURK|nr:hypothetical protein [Ramlibacter albus]MBC5765860.1 hypothetical protein [Ramlibacter albus]
MQMDQQHASPEGQPQGEDQKERHGGAGKGAESALARMKQQERQRATLRPPETETRSATSE